MPRYTYKILKFNRMKGMAVLEQELNILGEKGFHITSTSQQDTDQGSYTYLILMREEGEKIDSVKETQMQKWNEKFLRSSDL